MYVYMQVVARANGDFWKWLCFAGAVHISSYNHQRWPCAFAKIPSGPESSRILQEIYLSDSVCRKLLHPITIKPNLLCDFCFLFFYFYVKTFFFENSKEKNCKSRCFLTTYDKHKKHEKQKHEKQKVRNTQEAHCRSGLNYPL